MSKKSPEPDSNRLPTDGGISAIDLSPMLGGDGGGGPSDDDTPNQLTFVLADVPSAALRLLTVGEGIVFARRDRRIAAMVERAIVGYVPASYAQRIRGVIENHTYAAWVSDLGHRTVSVTVEW